MILLFLIGNSITSVGLDEWTANRLISSDTTPKQSVRRLSSTILMLAFVMPSGMARTVTFMPIIDTINRAFGIDERSGFRRLAYYVVGHLNPVASLALMTGGGMSVAAAGLIGSLVKPVTWVEWAVYMAPPVVVLFAASFSVAGYLYRVNGDRLTSVDSAISTTSTGISRRDGLREPSEAPLTGEQKLVAVLLFVAVLLWVVGSFVGFPTIVPAMLVVLVLSLPGIRVLTAEDVRTISWEVIFLVGTMLSLIRVVRDVNAFEVVLDTVGVGVSAQMPTVTVLLLVLLVATLVRALFSSIAASFIVLLPILLELTSTVDVNPLYLSFGLAIILMSTTFLPFNNPTVMVAYERGPLRNTEVFVLGVLTLLLSIVVVSLSWIVYWPFVDSVVAAFGG